jgi:hypothetical protein
MRYYDQVKDDRNEWIMQTITDLGNLCMICGRTSHVRPDCHEPVRRSHAPRQWGIRANYLLACRECHDRIVPSMPLSQQLAYKLLHDPDHFDLPEINRIKGGEPVLLRHVIAHLKFMLH